MRDRHLHIPKDSKLLKLINARINKEMFLHEPRYLLLLWAKFAFYVAVTLASYAALYSISNAFLFVLGYILYGFSSLLFAFNFAHDFSHNTVFKRRTWNNIGFTLIYTLVGAHAEAWKQRHVNSHHYAPNVEDYDSDLKISNLIRVIPNSRYCWFHRYQHLYAPLAYTTYSLFWVFIKDFVILFSKDDYTKNKGIAYHSSFWLQKLFYLSYLLVLPALFSQQNWAVALTGFLLMHLAQSLFLLFTFFMTHHVESTKYPTTDEEGYIKTSWLMNQIESSNDMHPFSQVANFILGGFNNHIAHHLFPHIHHIHYPRLNKILYSVLRENGITPNQTSYVGGIISHLRLLKRMSIEDQSSTQEQVVTGASLQQKVMAH